MNNALLWVGLVVLGAACGTSSLETIDAVSTEQGGSSGQGGQGAAGFDSSSPNCTEIVLDGYQSLDDVPVPWVFENIENQEMLIHNGHLKLAWGGHSFSSSSDEIRRFSLSEFDLKKKDTSKIIFPSFGSSLANAWSPSGVYATAGDVDVFLGTLDSQDEPLQLALDASPSPWLITHIAWDGEAFAVHLHHLDRTLAVARVSQNGELLLPLTPYGQTPSPGRQLGHRITTDPVSGNTYVSDGYTSLLINGHRRDGSSLWGGQKEALPLSAATYQTAMSSDPEGAFVVTSPKIYKLEVNPPRVYRVTPDGELHGPWTLPMREGENTNREYAVASTSAKDAWFIANSRRRLYLWEMKEGEIGPPRILIDTGLPSPPSVVPDDDWAAHVMSFSFLRAYNFGQQKWIVLEETTTPLPRLRILRVDDPSCTYAPRKYYQP